MANYQSRYTGPEIDERLRKAGEAVLTEAQSLDADKQAQARENIGAASSAAVDGKYTKPSGGIPKADLASGVQASLGKADTAYQKPASGIPASDIAEGVIPDVSQFITKSVNDLANYYLKTETYTKAEVQQLISTIQGFSYEVVATLPTASADTMGKIYLVPSSDPQQRNVKDEYITIDNGASVHARYTWEQIGSTAVDLSGYVTTSDLNTALAAYTTSSDLATLLAGKQDTISDLATIRSGAAAGATAYQKPAGGIPKSDLASGVQSSLAKADTALQEHQDISGKADKVSGATSGDFAGLDSNGNLTDSGSKASDFATAAQGAKADSAYQMPQGGIPATDLADKYAGSPSAGGPAFKALGIPYGAVDANSTATDIKATVDNFPTTLVAGVCAYIRNDIIASASGFTLNVNGTGALPVYSTMSDASRATTVFTATSTYLFVYNPTRVEGGCWDIYFGYNSDTNTIGYNLRTNGITAVAAAKFYRYRLLFTSPDGHFLIPSNTSSSTNATAAKTVNQAKIDPFAPIWYYSTTTAIEANAGVSASYLWMQYSAIPLGYAFNRTGAALTMTARYPVYLKCAPQSDGSAIMDADTPIVQALPSAEDGKIYIFLGYAESAVNITLYYHHPVYYYKDGAIRQWTNAAAGGGGGEFVLTMVSPTTSYGSSHVGNIDPAITTEAIHAAIADGKQIVLYGQFGDDDDYMRFYLQGTIAPDNGGEAGDIAELAFRAQRPYGGVFNGGNSEVTVVIDEPAYYGTNRPVFYFEGTTPAISQNIAQDKTVTNKTTSPKAVADYVDKPEIVEVNTASATINAAMNTIYQWTTDPDSITVTLPSAPTDVTKGIVLLFKTDAIPTLALPGDVQWDRDDAPVFEQNRVYRIEIQYCFGAWLARYQSYATPVILPAGYTKYLWIGKESGTGYIDTAYVPKSKPRLITEVMVIGASSDADLFGSAGTPFFIFNPAAYGNNNSLNLYYKYGNKTSGVIEGIPFGINTWHNVDAKESITIDTNEYAWATGWDYSGNAASVRLFGGRNSNIVYWRFKRVKLYDGDTPVRDLIPCTDANDVPGMYDLISQTFYGSAVAGQTFVVGND